jgi:hypothetical protein
VSLEVPIVGEAAVGEALRTCTLEWQASRDRHALRAALLALADQLEAGDVS